LLALHPYPGLSQYGAKGTPPATQAQTNPELLNAMRNFGKWAVFASLPFIGGFTIPAAVPLIGGLGPSGMPAVSSGIPREKALATKLTACRPLL
jgi:hypothetical protein